MFCEVSAEEEVKAKPHEADLFTCLPAHLPPTELNATERHWPHLLQQMRIFHRPPSSGRDCAHRASRWPIYLTPPETRKACPWAAGISSLPFPSIDLLTPGNLDNKIPRSRDVTRSWTEMDTEVGVLVRPREKHLIIH